MSLKTIHDWLDVCAKVVILTMALSATVAIAALAYSLFRLPR